MAWFNCAVKRPISANTGGKMTQNLGLFLHHAVANGSLFNFFNNPANQVSAHFWVSQTGLIEQYVDSETVAWHAKQANSLYVGVETEGCVNPPYADPMTPAMIAALARLYSEGNIRHGWPLALCNKFGDKGFGYHRLAVQTACPCDVRVNTRQTILNAANPQPELIGDEEMIANTSTGNGYWTVTRDGAVYAFGDAQYKGNALGKVNGTIVGISGVSTTGYRLLASDGGVFCFNCAYLGRPDRV